MKNVFLALAALSLGACASSPAKFEHIELARTACYGFCPVYQLNVEGDGTVTFKGERFVGSTDGNAKLDKKALGELQKAFDKADFLTLNNQYRSQKDGCTAVRTDAPSIIIRYRTAEKDKTVRYYTGCQFDGQQRLQDLATAIDTLTQSSQWVKDPKR
ncbi:DUF6438 domain-containing protein [Gallaecimonas pentaromativorans]|uniref:DUF6438 domain-containing protein n=1 Tax=Gallaecimonas pentaromativorans TaxID=584787 RepID=A0A3N1P8K3_9GAMM|nr:DUF6438 domain-containing protein [Gallaecimonas pentaromativorans]ROQ24875.1 hypothetical protein EDC28_106122 [Gallaecimonas pentaromativorans]